ncbi:PREDICTED: uncharacterized protein LOC105109347 isoform X2 [Populus euphratica]|uniref:Uncharacterized protein LOC105109347 isoform X2 n=1 Tax=Populus euphratica TaxID=75702 RepID=A0AAJ6X1W2_POPEU|nr:PREDICTED: uncharacterized protein LOC105109347 isoform X2 [Populus euphratica]XP_011002342.1 PREDICTED: uncharacterized protein LOC105109347 isoform X2 [Populus euphratica]
MEHTSLQLWKACDKLCGNLFTLHALRIHPIYINKLQAILPNHVKYCISVFGPPMSKYQNITGRNSQQCHQCTPVCYGSSKHQTPTSNEFGISSAACGDGFIPLNQLSLPQNTTPLLKVMVMNMVFVKAEKVVDVALTVDDGTGWISCSKWFCVLTEKFSLSKQ